MQVIILNMYTQTDCDVCFNKTIDIMSVIIIM